MKKILLFVGIFILFGCSNYDSPSNAVKNYLNAYNNLDGRVLVEIENVSNKEEYTDKQREIYKDILKKQYKDLSYKIEKEEKNGEETLVTVKIKVYDLYSKMEDASIYLSEHMNEFYDEYGKYDSSKYIDYKLNLMKNTSNKIEYSIVFTTKVVDDKYKVVDITESDLEKIHGIYNPNI